jgi:hypothetical protein
VNKKRKERKNAGGECKTMEKIQTVRITNNKRKEKKHAINH